MKRRYRRYFIIMENEDGGYEISNNQQPKGHAKIEVSNDQGKMVLHCQNLKNLSEKRMRYRWYLVNTNKEEPTIIDIGPMEVDDNGKGEITWEFNGENVKATKETIDEFNLLTLLVESIGETRTVVAPLVGYIDKEKVNWRGILERKFYGTTTNNLSQRNRREEKEVKFVKEEKSDQLREAPKAVEKDEKNTIQKKKPQLIKDEKLKEEKPVVKEGTPEEKSIIKEAPPIKEAQATKENQKTNQIPPTQEAKGTKETPLFKENKAIDNGPVFKKEDHNKPMKEELPQQVNSYSTNLNHSYQNQNILNSLQAYIESTIKMFPKVNPFEEPMENYQWWHMYYNYQTMYRSHMPFIGYIDGASHTTQYYPYKYPTDCQRQIYQYQHYLFGIVYDENKEVKYYVYGIPGKKSKTEQPNGGKTGFEYWKPSRRGRVDEMSQGYWLLHIDPKTGGIARTLKTSKS